jgi:hypothetical protein
MHGDNMTAEARLRMHQSRFLHGHCAAPKGSPEYRTWYAWYNIHRRCKDVKSKDYPRYGGRGIQVCAEWSTYLNFLADMGLVPEGKSIDRIDNHGNYEAGNCKWSTKQEQARNRRTSKMLSICGETKTLAEWSEISGVPSSTIRMRLTRGEPIGVGVLQNRKVG